MMDFPPQPLSPGLGLLPLFEDLCIQAQVSIMRSHIVYGLVDYAHLSTRRAILLRRVNRPREKSYRKYYRD